MKPLLLALVLAYKMVVVATAYTPAECPNQYTATGTIPHIGTVAVDPSVIPYGTRMYIPGYGYGVAEDCGGEVKGVRIDAFMFDHSKAMEWGRHPVEVEVLKEE